MGVQHIIRTKGTIAQRGTTLERFESTSSLIVERDGSDIKVIWFKNNWERGKGREMGLIVTWKCRHLVALL